MARTGRFGSIPGRSPDLTATIVALMERYEGARDSNILAAWSSGGTFEGSKVTDERIKRWFKARRDEYTRDDPEWDHWDQQFQQIDYRIDESKMLLRYEQGRLTEAGASRWYKASAKKFPKNSEAWREAMRNAARFKKATQERSQSASNVSKSEQYQKRVYAIERTKVQPALAAVSLFEEMLQRVNLSGGEAGLRGLDITSLAQGDELLDEFLGSRDGRRFGKRWKNLTGDRFGWHSLKGMMDTAHEGTKQQARIARRFGYESYVPGYKERGREFKGYGQVVSLFRSGQWDVYREAAAGFRQGMLEAETAAERNGLRSDFAKTLHRLERKADKRGDNAFAGAVRGERLAVTGVTVTTQEPLSRDPTGRAAASGTSGAQAGEPRFIEGEEGVIDPKQYDTTSEYDFAYATQDAEIAKGLVDGTWVIERNPVTGKHKEVPMSVFTGGVIPIKSHATDYVRLPAVTLPNGDMISGGQAKVAIPKHEMQFLVGNEVIAVPGVLSWSNEDGVQLYSYAGGNGQFVVTSVVPFDIDDDDPTTPPGFWRNPQTGGVEPVYGEPIYDEKSGVVTQTLHPFHFAPPAQNVDEADQDFELRRSQYFSDRLSEQQLDTEAIERRSARPARMEQVPEPTAAQMAQGDSETGQQYKDRMRQLHSDVVTWQQQLAQQGVEVENPASESFIGWWGETDVRLSGGRQVERIRAIESADAAKADEDQRDWGWQTGKIINPEDPKAGYQAWLALDSSDPLRKSASLEGAKAKGAYVEAHATVPEAQRLTEARGAAVFSEDTAQARLTQEEFQSLDHWVRNSLGRGGWQAFEDADDDTRKAWSEQAGVFIGEQAPALAAATEARVTADGEEARFSESVEQVQGDIAVDDRLTPAIVIPKAATLPVILSEAAFTYDLTGVTMGFAGSQPARERLAAMPLAEREVVYQSVVEDMGWESNAEMQAQLVAEFDAITAHGQPGAQEDAYWVQEGALMGVRDSVAQSSMARRVRDAQTDVSPLAVTVQGDPIFIADLESSGLSREQINTKFPWLTPRDGPPAPFMSDALTPTGEPDVPSLGESLAPFRNNRVASALADVDQALGLRTFARGRPPAPTSPGLEAAITPRRLPLLKVTPQALPQPLAAPVAPAAPRTTAAPAPPGPSALPGLPSPAPAFTPKPFQRQVPGPGPLTTPPPFGAPNRRRPQR